MHNLHLLEGAICLKYYIAESLALWSVLEQIVLTQAPTVIQLEYTQYTTTLAWWVADSCPLVREGSLVVLPLV